MVLCVLESQVPFGGPAVVVLFCFHLEDNLCTMFCWFLPYISENQSYILRTRYVDSVVSDSLRPYGR